MNQTTTEVMGVGSFEEERLEAGGVLKGRHLTSIASVTATRSTRKFSVLSGFVGS